MTEVTKDESGTPVAAAARTVNGTPPSLRADAPAPPSVLALIQCLRGGSPAAQRFAAHSLGRLGPLARSAVPQLRRALRSRSRAVRRYARWALRQIAP